MCVWLLLVGLGADVQRGARRWRRPRGLRRAPIAPPDADGRGRGPRRPYSGPVALRRRRPPPQGRRREGALVSGCVESNSGRPTPSTQRCPRDRWRGNLIHWLISTQDALGRQAPGGSRPRRDGLRRRGPAVHAHQKADPGIVPRRPLPRPRRRRRGDAVDGRRRPRRARGQLRPLGLRRYHPARDRRLDVSRRSRRARCVRLRVGAERDARLPRAAAARPDLRPRALRLVYCSHVCQRPGHHWSSHKAACKRTRSQRKGK